MRLSNGELSERRLARLTGISQPHVHNVLKGKRILSPRAADQILHRLELTCSRPARPGGIGAQHLLCLRVERPLRGSSRPGGLARSGAAAAQAAEQGGELSLPRVLRSLHGPPRGRPPRSRRPDAGPFRENDLVLLDRSPSKRLHLEEEAFYVVNRHGEGVMRRLQVKRDDLLLLTIACAGRAATGRDLIRLDGRASARRGQSQSGLDRPLIVAFGRRRGHLLIDLEHLARGGFPTEAPRLLVSSLNQRRAQASRWSDASRIPLAISKTFSGFTSTAASPTTSGSELTLEVTTGVPEAMASSGGQPEAFIERREDEGGGRRVEGPQRVERHEAEKPDERAPSWSGSRVRRTAG